MWAGRISAAKNICRTLLERDHDLNAEGPRDYASAMPWSHKAAGRGAAGTGRAAGSPGLTDAERAGARAWAGYARLSLVDLDGASAQPAKCCPPGGPIPGHQRRYGYPRPGQCAPPKHSPRRWRSSTRPSAWLTRARAGEVTASRSTSHEDSFSPSSTGSMRPDPRSAPAGGSARNSAPAGTCPTIR
jgi:hypothetical protein